MRLWMWTWLRVFWCMAGGAWGLLPALENCSLLDLTHPFDENTLEWPIPGEKSFRLDKIYKGETKHGFYISAYKYSGSEHAGTHWDAPSHFSSDGRMPEQVEVSNLIGEACVVNLEAKIESNVDYQLTKTDLTAWEEEHGRISTECILLLATGWDQRYTDRDSYFGTDPKGFHFPGIHPDTAQWLVTERSVRAVGVDFMSVDYGPTPVGRFETHQVLAEANVPILENLRLLTRLPHRGATVLALPMKMTGGSGGPVRVVAVGWHGSLDPCRRQSTNSSMSTITSCLLLCLCTTLVSRCSSHLVR